MGVSKYIELMMHVGHRMECVAYAPYDRPEDVANVAIECIDCHEVMVDFDHSWSNE